MSEPTFRFAAFVTELRRRRVFRVAAVYAMAAFVVIQIGAFFIALGNSLVTPAVMAVISIRSADHEQGTAMGVTQSLASLGRILGPPYGAITYAQINFYFPFLSAAGIALGALGIYARRERK